MKTFEQIWEKVAKSEGEGTRVMRYASQDDLVFLYASGFVDADTCSLEQWIKAFDDSKTKKGDYVVSYKQWMAKEKYYYSGPVRPPFDARKIPEREFSEEEFVDLYRQCIIPSSQTTEKQIPAVVADFKKRGLLKDGKIMMDAAVKKELGDFIAAYPSPLRILEINVQKLLTGEIATTGAAATDAMAGGYVKGKAQSKTTQDQLSSLLGGHAKPGASEKKTREDVHVKDLQKKVKHRPV